MEPGPAQRAVQKKTLCGGKGREDLGCDKCTWDNWIVDLLSLLYTRWCGELVVRRSVADLTEEMGATQDFVELIDDSGARFWIRPEEIVALRELEEEPAPDLSDEEIRKLLDYLEASGEAPSGTPAPRRRARRVRPPKCEVRWRRQ